MSPDSRCSSLRCCNSASTLRSLRLWFPGRVIGYSNGTQSRLRTRSPPTRAHGFDGERDGDRRRSCWPGLAHPRVDWLAGSSIWWQCVTTCSHSGWVGSVSKIRVTLTPLQCQTPAVHRATLTCIASRIFAVTNCLLSRECSSHVPGCGRAAQW